jgi:hypothetical protein
MSVEEFNKYKTRTSGSQLAGFLLEHGGSVQIIPPTEMLSMNGIKLKARLKVKGVAGTFEKGDKSIVFTVMAGKGGGKADQSWVKQGLRTQLGVSALDVVDAPNAAIDPDPTALKPQVGSISTPPPPSMDLGDLDLLDGLDALDGLDTPPPPPPTTGGSTDAPPPPLELGGLDDLDLLDGPPPEDPTEHIREVVSQISQCKGVLEGLQHTDALSTLTGAVRQARALEGAHSGSEHAVIRSHLEATLRLVPPVERLIVQLTAKDDKLPEGHRAVRQGLVQGDFATRVTDKTFVAQVQKWIKELGDEPSIEAKEDLIGMFKADIVEGVTNPGSKDLMFTLLDQALKHSRPDQVSREEVEGMGSFKAMPGHRRTQILNKHRETEEQAAARKIEEDKGRGETYLSSGYRMINPLLAAFDALGVDPSNHRDPEYNFNSIQDKVLEKWREIAVQRNMADQGMADTWDRKALHDTYENVRAMARVWDKFTVPEIPGGVVARGDIARHLYGNYPALDPSKNGLGDGEHAVSVQITWPGIMSTTLGDPKSHNFIQAKSFIWRFSVADGHPGRIIGANNPSEQEVTFPVGVKVSISKLIIRTGEDKSLKSSEFGSTAEVIAYATLS